MKVRKSSRAMTAAKWENFICAFKNIKEGLFKGVAKPTLDDFADEHAAAFKEKNHGWYVHSHGEDRGHWGLMFLAWHRVFLNEFENRLRREVPGVSIPYWNAFKAPFPEELKKISDNEGKSVNLTTANLPNFSQTDFETFQNDLEVTYHNPVHAILGRTMGRAHSPRDAGFWLHHAFVDRQWGHWFQKPNGATPPSMESLIKGDEIVKGKKVKDVLHTSQLDYVYDNGVYSNIEREGSESSSILLEEGMILSVKLQDDYHAKILVSQLTSVAAFLILQQFPYFKPSTKLGVFPPNTTYCDLILGKFEAPQDKAHVHITKKTVGSNVSYFIKPVNGVRLAKFTGITDFTANNGEGATDFEMLYI
jgi:tyrosinase